MLYAGLALAAAGADAVLCTRCAPADEELLRPLRATGLPVAWRPAAATARFRIENDGDTRAMWIEDPGCGWSLDDAEGWVGEAIAGAEWVHAGALWRGEFPADVLAVLGRGRRLCLDAHALVRPGRTGPVEADGSFDPRVLEHVHVLHLSEAELGALGLSLEPSDLAGLRVPEILVTLGERGCVVVTGASAHHVPAEPVDDVDPTGAGDLFTASYLAWRATGCPPQEAAREASRATARLIGRPGR